MTSPKFSVGETVVLQSKSMPWYNGVYTINDVLDPNKEVVCRLSGRKIGGCLLRSSYRLCTPLSHYNFSDYETIWMESAIRKYFPPEDLSKDSFQEILDKLKGGVVVW